MCCKCKTDGYTIFKLGGQTVLTCLFLGTIRTKLIVTCFVSSAFPDEYGTVRVNRRNNVKLPCHVTPSTSTNVTWLHRDRRDVYNIYINSQIDKNLRRRFSVYSSAMGDYSLKMLNIQPFDAGRYHCFNGQQLLQTYAVYVSG